MKKTLLVMLMLISSILVQSQIYPTRVSKPAFSDKSIRLDEMKPIYPYEVDMSWKDGTVKNYFRFKDEFKSKSKHTGEDPILQKGTREISSVPLILHNFPGQVNTSGVAPPDTDGDVSLDHYMQMVNLTLAVYDKSGNLLYGPVNNSTLWNGFDGPWTGTNSGDPIVLYDEYADRWIATQFALVNYPNGPFYELIAVSETSDPLGSWYRYAYQFTNMPDYPKFGVWNDGYYFTVNQFAAGFLSWAGAGVAVVDRDAMLIGDLNAEMIFFDLGTAYGSLLPADADGSTLPPAGQSAFLLEMIPDALYVWETDINWSNPGSSTCVISSTISTTPFSWSGISINQPGTSTTLMAISDRLMYRTQYRNFGGYEVMLTNHTVNADGNGQAGIRWYELRDYGTGWEMYQQGTYAGTDSDNRWMASIAMNDNGDIALGYSVSSSTTYPSIRITGQNAASSGTGAMDIEETELLTGSASQTGINRWGDYSMMSIDPSDGTSFWYTQEASTGGWNWYTQISHFSFEPVTDPPVVDFEADDTSPIVGQTVEFYDRSSNVPHTWDWVFSPSTITYMGGTNSTFKYPKVRFNNSGVYTVSLTASNDIGTDSETKIDYIYVVDCSEKITIFPYIQNFDAWESSSPEMACTHDGDVNFDDCWLNASGDYLDYDIISGNTASGETGPSSDHTGMGQYIYTESSSCFNHDAIALTPIFDLTYVTDPEVSFWYHMYGEQMGSLTFYISTNGGSNWIELWSISGNQGNEWFNYSISLNSYTNESNVRFKFTAITGSNWHSDIAIDDFEILSTSVTKWIGTTSEWETVSNWTNGVPNSTLNGIIQSGYVFPLISTNNAETKNLIIQPNMTVTVGNPPSNNYSLIVHENFNIQSVDGLIISQMSDVTVLGNTNLEEIKSIIIKSEEYGTGSFIDNGTITYLNDASVEVQTWISNSSSPGSYYLHQVGTSVTDPLFDFEYAQQGVYLQGFDLALHGTWAYLYDEPTAIWTNIWPYDFPIPTTTGLILSTADSVNWVISMIGDLVTGNVSQNGLTYVQDGTPIDVGFMTNDLDGYNLVSNPYPSSISFDDVYNNSPTIDNTMYIWSHIDGNYGQYTVGGAGTLGVTENIQVGQGFFVQATDPNPSITFNNSWRQHSNNLFLAPTDNLNTIYLTAKGNEFRDQAVIYFNDSPDFDVKKWFGLIESTEIWIEPDNTVRVLPTDEIISSYDIPIYFKSGVDGGYSITANLDWFEFNWDVMLEDVYEGVNHNFRDNLTYEFSSSPEDDYYDRFILHLYGVVDVLDNTVDKIRVYSYDNYIYIIGKFDNVKVYNLSGQKIVETSDDRIYVDKTGIYVVSVDGMNSKVVIN